MSKYIPVEAEKWAEMVQAMALAADLMAENERLRKAGDAMADDLRSCQADEDNKLLADWNAAKEGRDAK